MAIVERNFNGILIFKVEGVMGVGGEEALHDRVQERIAEGARQFVFEMSHVRHVDSTGLASLIGAHASITGAGGRLILAGLNAHVTRVLTVTRLLTVFESRAREAEAVARLVGRVALQAPAAVAPPSKAVRV